MTTDIEMYQGSMNVYADLGYPDAEEMLIKAQLVAQIHSAIKRGSKSAWFKSA